MALPDDKLPQVSSTDNDYPFVIRELDSVGIVIGENEDLNTADKSSIVDAINEVLSTAENPSFLVVIVDAGGSGEYSFGWDFEGGDGHVRSYGNSIGTTTNHDFGLFTDDSFNDVFLAKTTQNVVIKGGSYNTDDLTNKLQVGGSCSLYNSGVYKINNVQVMGQRSTGWTDATDGAIHALTSSSSQADHNAVLRKLINVAFQQGWLGT